jgi:DNA polymerase-3 subunit epsilon
MREIVFDTETTGRDPLMGDRIVEIGCLELENLLPTGRRFHAYLNPERDVPEEVVRVHGLTNAFLADKPTFVTIAADLLDFMGEAVLVAHNASFDMSFLNHELKLCGFKPIDKSRVIDTLAMARRAAPGAPASLDALCRRFGIDNSNRTFHGALLDAQLLAEVYLELKGGRQPDLVLDDTIGSAEVDRIQRTTRLPRPHQASAEELEAHQLFLKQIKDPLWGKLAATSQS